MSDKFAQPANIDGLDVAFPTSVDHLMPAYRDLDEKYRRHYGTWGNRLFSDWFYCGLKSTDGLVPREGVDKQKALRHITTVMRSWDPKHEHKEAGCAFLFDKWFDGEKSTWERAEAA